jgi:hypothetical protein
MFIDVFWLNPQNEGRMVGNGSHRGIYYHSPTPQVHHRRDMKMIYFEIIDAPPNLPLSKVKSFVQNFAK